MSTSSRAATIGWHVLALPVTLIATIAIAFGAATLAIRDLNYGWTLFVGIPYFIGFFSSAIYRLWGPRSLRQCLMVASTASAAIASTFLLTGMEGIVCVVLAIPLALPVVLVGALMGHSLLHRSDVVPPGGAAAFLLCALGLSLWAEGAYRLTSPTYTVSNSVTIAASPDVVWDSLVSMGSLGQPRDLLFRLGIACPQRVDIFGRGEGAMRVCTLSTGQLRELIIRWEPGQRLGWVSLSTPPPLKELNPFREADPPHLHGFYRSVGGEFELQRSGTDVTRVTRSSSYQHNLFPAWYWRVWCDYVAARDHVYVLSVLKDSAESHATSARK